MNGKLILVILAAVGGFLVLGYADFGASGEHFKITSTDKIQASSAFVILSSNTDTISDGKDFFIHLTEEVGSLDP